MFLLRCVSDFSGYFDVLYHSKTTCNPFLPQKPLATFGFYLEVNENLPEEWLCRDVYISFSHCKVLSTSGYYNFSGILFVLLLSSYYSTLVSFRRKALVFIIFRYVSDISCHPQVLYQSEDFKCYFNLLYFNKKDLVLYYIESRNAIIGVDFK